MKVAVGAVIGFVLGILAATSVQNLLLAGEASKNKHAVANARTVATALEAFRLAKGKYPPLERGIAGLGDYLVPAYLRSVPPTDAYGREYIVLSDSSGAVIVSTGWRAPQELSQEI
jgi:type II secretory pathway pseudopilin PulG